MRHIALILALSCGFTMANTSVECQELLADQADPAILQKLEQGMLGEWKLATAGPDGRPALVSALRDATRGQWVFIQDERIALFAQQELQRGGDHRVFRIDVNGPLDGEALVQIFCRLLTAYHGRYVEPHEAPELLLQLMRTDPAKSELPVLIVWTFAPYTEIEGDRSQLWFNTFSATGMRRQWKQVVVSDDEAFLKRIGFTQKTTGEVPWRRVRERP